MTLYSESLKAAAGTCDVILNTVSANHEFMAGGLSKWSTRLTFAELSFLPLLRVSVLAFAVKARFCMSIHPADFACSDLGRVLVVNDPPA